jgi:hypothetical protein
MKLVILLTSLLLAACGGDNSPTANKKPPAKQPDPGQPAPKPKYPNARIIIPVVVHVLYRTQDALGNIKDSKIHSQIVALNNAFNRSNADLNKVPDMFQPLIADMQIEFRLADRDPTGNPTTGITRTLAKPTQPPDSNNFYDFIYYENSGGQNAWPRDKYLNIWVLDMRDRFGRVGFAGRASFPGGPAEKDGVLVATFAFGTEPPLSEPDGLTLGRTLVHEVGHWFGLYHLSGTAESCNVDDGIADTPLASSNYSGNPTHPSSTCGSVDMFMNFMAKPSDTSLLMFSKGQKEAVWKVLNEGGERHTLLKNYQAAQNSAPAD